MILFLYGPDTFRLEEKVRDIKKNSDDWDEVDTFLDLKNADTGTSLFSDSKTIFVTNFSEDFLELEDSHSQIVFYCEKPDKRTRLFKHLNSIANCEEFGLLESGDLESWIMDRAKISPGGASMLALRVGGDLWRLDEELKKLSAFVNYEKMIDEEDVKVLVPGKVDPNIFETIDLLARGDKKGALNLIANHLYSGDDENYLFGMFVYQFRVLLKIATDDLSGLHPFVVKKSRPLLERYSLENLKSTYRKLLLIGHQSNLGVVEKPATSFVLLAGDL